jgi:hypothetical protein
MTNIPNPNIRFAYMYCDAGNYKQHGEAIFSNEALLKIEDVDRQIHFHLSDGQFFIARQLHLEERFFDVMNADDHPWHEYVKVEVTDDPTFEPGHDHKRDITEFMAELEKVHHVGWDEMNVRGDLIKQLEKERHDLMRWLDSVGDGTS